jgi:hypothetical protein
MDNLKVFDEVTASNKDETKPWGRFFVGLYDKEVGVARDFRMPTSDERVGNLKSKIVNQFWPAMSTHVNAKLEKRNL